MHESHLANQMEHWGYFLLPKVRVHCPGYSGLLVAMRETPTQAHFDPEVMRVRYADQSDAGWATIKLHSALEDGRHVLAGRIIVSDRVDKRVEFFTFGSSITVETTPHEVIYSVTSTAPILELTDDTENTANQIASEAEGVIAVCKASYAQHDDQVEAKFAVADPMALYVTALRLLIRHYERRQSLREGHHLTYAILTEERKWLLENGQWQTAIPASDTLYAQE